MATTDKQIGVDIETMRHSFAHVLAMAVQRVYPGVRFGIGPATKNGFYYEFEFPDGKKLKESDLPLIEKEMHTIIGEEIPFKQIVVNREQAFNTLTQLGQIYKSELLQTVPDTQISFYRTGEEFIDLCRGSHVSHTGLLGAFKLTSISNTHWLNDSSRPMLQRIEGLGFLTEEELRKYEETQIELKDRNHQKQGVRLNLFATESNKNTSSVYWLPKGLVLKNVIENSARNDMIDGQYEEVVTPLLNSERIRNSFLKNAYAIFSNRRRSYKELPLRIFELGSIMDNSVTEAPGLYKLQTPNSLEAFAFSSKHDLAMQVINALNLDLKIYKSLGISIAQIELCVPDLSGVALNDVEKKELNDCYQFLKAALTEAAVEYKIVTKEQFLYFDPYIAFSIRDIYDNYFTIGRIVAVYNPKLKVLQYTNAHNNREMVTPIYNQIIVSIEAIIAHMLEEYDGALPLWASPVQVDLLSISEKYNQYITQLNSELVKEGIRTNIDLSDATIQTKIRKSQLARVPYMLIIGEKEIKTNSVSVRNRVGQELGLIRIDEFVEKLKTEVNIEKNVVV
jgi:threonyl-tRNA synthetase